jgi:hypothetical protein
MPPRATAILLLALAVTTLGAALVVDDACDEPCGVHCGDCFWCPLHAELLSANGAAPLSAAAVVAGAGSSSRPAYARTLDHIPIPA